MTYIEYFKLQAKNLLKDYQTKTPCLDDDINNYFYEYSPKYFDIDEIILSFDIDEENFTLMKAQHIISLMIGFNKWSDLLKASEIELELKKLIFDNGVHVEDWEMYLADVEQDLNETLDPESKLNIFKKVYLDLDSR